MRGYTDLSHRLILYARIQEKIKKHLSNKGGSKHLHVVMRFAFLTPDMIPFGINKAKYYLLIHILYYNIVGLV